MGVFICAKCGCIENTATSSYWSVVHKLFLIEYDERIKEYKGKPLCSECGKLTFDDNGSNPRMIPGQWHNLFPKKQATVEEKKKVGKDGLIHY